ncbi:MAG: hypothetical protein AAFN91_03360 [Pseudomonadota bacterium]
MKKVIVGLWLIFAPAAQAVAQEFDDQIVEIAEYAQELRPVVESVYDIVNVADQADFEYAQWEAGDLSDEQFLSMLAAHKVNVRNTTKTIREAFAAIPPPSTSTFSDAKFGMSSGEFESLLHACETFSIDILDLYAKIVEGDENALKDYSLSVYDRGTVMIAVSNSLAQSSIDSIGDQNHPQRSALTAVINSNDVMLALLGIQKAMYFEDETDGLDAAIDHYRSLIKRHREILRQGRRQQRVTTFNLNSNLAAFGEDRPMTERILKMIAAYEDQWALELSMAEWMSDVSDEIEEFRSDHETLDFVIIQATEDFIPFENERTRLIYERVQMLK